jgi:cellulose synthase/poly-beta-1,6-N-acetylglucosamine synthase-like glycosyltransferase
MASRRPELSVVLTLVDHEGHAAECVQSWARAQDLPRERYEVIAVASGREPEVEQQIRPLLGTEDRVLEHPDSQELALHDHGARAARGRWILFTEAHTVAEPDCLSSLLRYLSADGSGYAGACIRSFSDGSDNPVARCEQRWYADGFREWSREGDWRKVTIRGFAIRRDAYLDVGGFEHRFGCFAETALAARLAEGGYRLGCAEDAAVKHYDATDLAPLLRYVREYREGELAYRETKRPEYGDHWFGELPPALGPAGRARERLRYLIARVRFARPGLSEDQRYERFRELWQAASDWEQQRALRRVNGASRRRVRVPRPSSPPAA